MLSEASDILAAEAVPVPVFCLEEAVKAAIDELRPTLQRDGGDIQLIAIDGDMIVVDMKGACSDCVLASVTLGGVRKKIIDKVGRPLRVVPKSALVPGRPR